MMFDRGTFIAQYKHSSLRELLKARRELLWDIDSLQCSMCFYNSPVYDMEPDPEIRISMYMEYVQMMDLLINKRSGQPKPSNLDVIEDLAYLRISFDACDDSLPKDSRIESWSCFLESKHSDAFKCLHVVYGGYPGYNDNMTCGFIERSKLVKLLKSLEVQDWENEYHALVFDGVCWLLSAIGTKGNFGCYGLNSYAPTYERLTEQLSLICSKDCQDALS